MTEARYWARTAPSSGAATAAALLERRTAEEVAEVDAAEVDAADLPSLRQPKEDLMRIGDLRSLTVGDSPTNAFVSEFGGRGGVCQ